MAPPRLSVVIPAYNEALRLGSACAAVAAFCRRSRRPFEIVIVNDGSRDATREAAALVAGRWREVRVISYPVNRGKGYAVRRGVLAARGRRILFLDADLSTRPEEWPKLERRLAAGADLAIGSRKMAGARLVRRQPWWRERMGKVFTWLVRRFLVDVSDATCGFKGFTREAARALFARSRLDDWSYDAEILYIAQRRGLRIDEVPVVWKDNPNSKVHVAGAALNALRGLVRIRLNDLLGRYA
ncbi:MAG: dolichyl-phosphate beta-glucosyltransferase [Candidatus Coatesbacteria bacterium]